MSVFTQEAKDRWHRAYMDRLIERMKLTEEEALAALDAGMDEFDYDDDPTDAADEELSYWDRG